jgi:hypothetical protein
MYVMRMYGQHTRYSIEIILVNTFSVCDPYKDSLCFVMVGLADLITNKLPSIKKLPLAVMNKTKQLEVCIDHFVILMRGVASSSQVVFCICI